jgi:hypothetical protein
MLDTYKPLSGIETLETSHSDPADDRRSHRGGFLQAFRNEHRKIKNIREKLLPGGPFCAASYEDHLPSRHKLLYDRKNNSQVETHPFENSPQKILPPVLEL